MVVKKGGDLMGKTFGDCLRDSRIKAGYSLRAFAKEVGMQPSNLSLIENDKTNPPRDKEILFKYRKGYCYTINN